MTLLLQRLNRDDRTTIGLLSIDDFSEAYTLEPAHCIPAGTYQLDKTISRRARAGTLWTPDEFDRLLILRDVPGWLSIRIHAGNTYRDTNGCIIVGISRAENMSLSQSREALTQLMLKVNLPAEIHIKEIASNDDLSS